MKILFVWTGITSYMADCWRELQARRDIELKVVVDPLTDAQSAFKAERELHDLDYRIARRSEEVAGETWMPDVIFLVGWRSEICRYFALDKKYEDVPKICCLDMPWRWKVRCLFAPLFLRRYARRFAAAYVPGAVCERYCKWIGFRRVEKGLFAIDTTRFARSEAGSSFAKATEDKGYFLYLGRYSKEKRIGDMVEAYKKYRATGGTKELRLYGKGADLPRGIEDVPGVRVNGFVAPSEVPTLYAGAAAFVLASAFDPWPLVLLEAMSAGCRVIASSKCTNYPELGATWGRFKVGDTSALAREMTRVDELQVAGREVIAPYDCKTWTERTLKICSNVLSRS